MGWATRQKGTRLAANRIVFIECDKFRRQPHAPTTIVESPYLVTAHLIIAYLVTPDLITVDGFVTQNDIALCNMEMQVYFGWMYQTLLRFVDWPQYHRESLGLANLMEENL